MNKPKRKTASKPASKKRTAKLDPRMHLLRPDLAASHLKGKVKAERFVDPQEMIVRGPIAPLKAAPDPNAALDSVLLFGETFDVCDTAGGWAWGQSRRDGYVGYIPEAALGEPTAVPTHRIALPQVHLYPRPDIKSEPVGLLALNALVNVLDVENGFAALEGGLFAWNAHLEEASKAILNTAATAKMFLHTPYLWGGRTAQGIDCSGLVQIALQRAGIKCPRDSDQQQRALGKKVDPDGPLESGDLVFWPGHVGLMTTKTTLIHANQHHMRVSAEPLKTVRKRILEIQGDDVTSVRRIEQK